MTTDLHTETRRNPGSWQMSCANVNRESSANIGQSGKSLLRPVFVRAHLLVSLLQETRSWDVENLSLVFFLKGTKKWAQHTCCFRPFLQNTEIMEI